MTKNIDRIFGLLTGLSLGSLAGITTNIYVGRWAYAVFFIFAFLLYLFVLRTLFRRMILESVNTCESSVSYMFRIHKSHSDDFDRFKMN